MTKDNELAVAQGYALAMVDFTELAEELDGLGGISFDAVKLPSGGGLAFEVPGDDPDSPDIVKELVGVIVTRKATNGYWTNPFGGDNKAPDCFSDNGKTGVVTATGECRDCATCPLNQFADDGSGKKCKNMQNLYMMREGDSLPLKLVLPPTSLKNLRDYVAKRLIAKGKKLGAVVTGITLSKTENKQGIKYAVAQFSKKRDLSAEEIRALAPAKSMVESVLASQVRAAAAEDFAEVVEDEPLPFDAEIMPT